MNQLRLAALTLALCVAPLAVQAEALDGSRPALCAMMATTECDRAGPCESGLSDHVDLARFVRFDFKGKEFIALDGPRKGAKTPIQSVVNADGRLMLLGTEGGRAWSAAIVRETGDLSLAIAADHHAWIVFGACTAQ